MIGAAAVPAYATSAAATAPAMSTTPASVLAMDQALNGNEVMIEYAYMPADGYLLVYSADKDGKKVGDPIGKLALKAGDHRKIKVTLLTAPPPGTALWASLYGNADGKPGVDRAQDKSFWAQAVPIENRFYIR